MLYISNRYKGNPIYKSYISATTTWRLEFVLPTCSRRQHRTSKNFQLQPTKPGQKQHALCFVNLFTFYFPYSTGFEWLSDDWFLIFECPQFLSFIITFPIMNMELTIQAVYLWFLVPWLFQFENMLLTNSLVWLIVASKKDEKDWKAIVAPFAPCQPDVVE